MLLALGQAFGQAQKVRLLKLGTVPGKMAYDQAVLEVQPQEVVEITFHNSDRMQHNWVLCKPGVENAMIVAKAAWQLGDQAAARQWVPDSTLVLHASPIVNPDQTVRFRFTTPPVEDDYPFVCTLPGHAFIMRGYLRVGRGSGKPIAELQQQATLSDKVARAAIPNQKNWQHVDFGELFSGTIFPPDNVPASPKGIAIKVGDEASAAVLFDADTLVYRCGWANGFLRFAQNREDKYVENRHHIIGDIMWSAPQVAGNSGDGIFTDPRPKPLGPTPKTDGQFLGIYRHGKRNVLHYRLRGTEVLDHPWSHTIDGQTVFIRELEIGPSDAPLRLCVMHFHGGSERLINDGSTFRVETKDSAVCAAANGGLLMYEHEFVSLQVPPSKRTRTVKVAFTVGGLKLGQARKWIADTAKRRAPSPKRLAKGAAPRWPVAVHTQGTLGASDTQAYVIDEIALPFNNPYNAIFYVAGHDFFEGGKRAAICTAHGEVWIVDGIDSKLTHLRWRRFATGLANPLGLKIYQGNVHVICHDGLVRLHDLNRDGEADYYQRLNNDMQVSDSHHRFTTDLWQDAEGNFYFSKCTEEGRTDHGGCVIRVPPDGNGFEIIATGLRNPNGMSFGGRRNVLSFSDQQGGWKPASLIQFVREGAFYGYMPSHHRDEEPKSFSPPMCWIPHGVDNSSAGQAWVPDDRWGPFAGRPIHLSYGRCTLFLVMPERVASWWQGGVVQIPVGPFQSGAMRARFNAADGQLYVSGMRGWQTSAKMSGCFSRVRYTGKPTRLPQSMAVDPRIIRLRFAEPIDPQSATDLSRYKIQRWNYRWTQHYGSPEFKVSNPEEKGRDDMKLLRATASRDNHSVVLYVEDLKPVMQMRLHYDILAADGHPLKGDIYHTINTTTRLSLDTR